MSPMMQASSHGEDNTAESYIQKRVQFIQGQHQEITQRLLRNAGMQPFYAQCAAWEEVINQLMERFDHGKL
jgi:hypothetical protein